ncbi:hypothetical protein GC207_11190 [bacterium]|nr:hypothetical protein [bacterium]
MNSFKTILALTLISLAAATHAADKRILLVAGRPSHPPGEHEFRAGVLLWQQCLKSVPGIQVEVYTNGWPDSDAVFEGASAVVFYADGGGGHPAIQGDRIKLIDALVAKGVGIGCAHYAVEVPVGAPQQAMWRWIGGAYEDHYSVNPMWQPDYKNLPRHPVTNGVKPFSLPDEWYFNMRWNPDPKGITHILTDTPSDAVRKGPYVYPAGPYQHIVDASGRRETMMWIYERPDGGRGFGFTGGHKHVNWYNDNQRKIVLNAILWIAKVAVPENGVESTVTPEEIAANLDPKKGADQLAQIAGHWNVDVEVNGNAGKSQLQLVQAGHNIVGTYDGLLGHQQITGYVNGKNVKLDYKGELNGNAMSVEYAGKLNNDGTLAGDIKLPGGDNNLDATWTAKRSDR